jgi:hypothetical protein
MRSLNNKSAGIFQALFSILITCDCAAQNELINCHGYIIRTVSFIKYRLLRLKKITVYRVYFIIKYLIFLYIRMKVKLGWY